MEHVMRFMRKSGLLFACLFLFLTLFPSSVHAKDEETVRVGWYEDAYNITGENGERSGYGYEFQQSVAAYTGWTYDYVNAGWSDLFEMIQNGQIDLMSGVSYTEERAQNMLFSELPMGEEKYYLYADLKHTDISASDLSTLNGKKIGILENSVQETEFDNWEKSHDLSLEKVGVNSFEEGKTLAEDRKIDCVVSTETPAWVKFGISSIATIGGSDIYFVVNKNRPDLKAELDNAMRKMESDRPFYADDLYKRYLSSVSSSVISSEEKTWLNEHGKIKVGWLNNDSGISTYNSLTGKPVGVINEYLEYAENCLENRRLEFETVRFDDLDEEVEALKDGRIDMIFHVSENPYIAETNGLTLSNTVMSTNMVAVTAKDYLDESSDNVVAIVKDNIPLKWNIQYCYSNWKIVEYSSLKEAEKAVRNGEVDCFVTDSNLTKYSDDRNLYTVFLSEPANSCFAVRRDNTILMSILNKTLKTMPATLLTGSLNMYESSLRKVTVTDFVKDNLVTVSVMLISVFVIVLAVVLRLLKKSRLAESKAKQAAEQLQENHEELEKALVRAENANSAKTTFLNHMSHDIRTPMNAIIGFTNIALKQNVSDIVRNCLNRISSSSELLLTLINVVLDISRIESGQTEITPSLSNINDITDGAVNITSGLLLNRNLNFVVKREKTDQPYVNADAVRIREVLVNILSNAVKFTDDGGTVEFRSSTHKSEDGQTLYVCYVISDTGIGMSKEYLNHIFDEFSQEHSDARTRYKGTGLGMAITKSYVDMMHGTIHVESEKGKGSTFTVELPLEIVEKENDDHPSDLSYMKKTAGLHILLAEDNDLNAEIAAYQLKEAGMEVTRVVNGKEVVDLYETRSEGTFDLVLMDVMMPQMNGYDATKEIREYEKATGRKRIPVIAMTANAFAEDVKASMDAGMEGHISKPIVEDELIREVMRHIA